MNLFQRSKNSTPKKDNHGTTTPKNRRIQKAKNTTATHNGFKIYVKRWLMLLYISLLNLLSDWTCYSVAPIADLTSELFGTIDPTILVVIFFLANAISTACEPILLSRLGLRKTIVLGSGLLSLGSWLKSGFPGIGFLTGENLTTWRIYGGFCLVGMSQPLYQCTPALLSASWFPENERTMATGVALNSNQLGIGFAFVFGTIMVKKVEDIPHYFQCLTAISLVLLVGTLWHLEDAPPTPPSDTAKAIKGDLDMEDIMMDLNMKLPKHCVGKRALDDVMSVASSIPNHSNAYPHPSSNQHDSFMSADTIPLSDIEYEAESDYDISTAYSIPSNTTTNHNQNIARASQIHNQHNLEPVPIFLSPNHTRIQIRDDQILLSFQALIYTPGFLHALLAFSVSGIVINTLSTYMSYLIMGPSWNVGMIGGLFQIVLMGSSLCIGKITDLTRNYYTITIFLLVGGGFVLAKCALCLDDEQYQDDDNADSSKDFLTGINQYWLLVAALVGPLQPVATELGVDVAYPLSENTILVILQLCCNICSALFIPVFGWFRGYGNSEERPEYFIPLYLMIVLHSIATVLFATFNGTYLRLEHERKRKKNKKDGIEVDYGNGMMGVVQGEQSPLLGSHNR